MKEETLRKDITKPKDIHRIINGFFKRVKKDALLSPYFADKSKEDWDAFLPLMYSFWENALFYSGGYLGNPMQRHKELNDIRSFSAEHFTQWLSLFEMTIDDMYAGEKAELMKERARNIATVMQVKLAQQEKAG
jgi:hemoglobin